MRETLTRNGRVIMHRVDGVTAPLPPPPPVSFPSSGPRKTTLVDVQRFGRTVYHAAINNKPLVDPAEAERRAVICASCPMNVPIEGCVMCKTILRKIAEYVGARTTPHCNLLQGCGVCGCELKVAVWVDLETQQQAIDPETNAAFPSGCWKRRG